MTLGDYEERLRELTSEEFHRFNDDFGGGQKTVEQRIREFVDFPQHERRICQLLGLKTEAEKLTDAAISSASAAVQSATSARLSMIWSGIACLAAFIAAIVAIINLFWNH
jgi:hypothetical protein